jgi:hypothetical protein
MLEKYFDKTRFISNGFFYSFEYYPRHPKELYDKTPFLYCIGPVENRTNLITGINLHHIDLKSRMRLIEMMQRQYNILDDDKQHIISEESLNRLVPGILFGVRIYNLKNIFNPIRVRNPAVPLFLHEQGNIYLGTPDDKYMQYLFNSGIYKTSKYIK